MTITKLEAGYRKSIRVYIDEEYAFSLYQSEMNRYQLKEGTDISEACLLEINDNVIYRRGRKKVLELLKRMDYTESEIREKLKRSEYTSEMIERIMACIASYHYLDDERYAENYIRSKSKDKSKRQIRFELQKKGVAADIIAEKLEDAGDFEELAIQKAIRKKTTDISSLRYEEKQKLAASLFRKGFSDREIRNALDL